MKEEMDTLAVLDFGSQYAQLIARRIREAHIYCELFPWNAPHLVPERDRLQLAELADAIQGWGISVPKDRPAACLGQPVARPLV